MKFRWYKPVYMGERAKNRRFSLIQGLRLGHPKRGTYVITPSAGRNQLLDIYPAEEMRKPCYRDREFLIIGIAADYDDALELAGKIVGQMYRETGGFDLAGFLDGKTR